MTFDGVIDWVGRIIDLAGVLVIAAGILYILASRTIRARTGGTVDVYEETRRGIGRVILLGLELLVAADIIRTVAIDPTLDGVAGLALLVVIRTFLSFSLEVELYGHWPWERGATLGSASHEHGRTNG